MVAESSGPGMSAPEKAIKKEEKKIAAIWGQYRKYRTRHQCTENDKKF
jgi:hypothetical protein